MGAAAAAAATSLPTEMEAMQSAGAQQPSSAVSSTYVLSSETETWSPSAVAGLLISHGLLFAAGYWFFDKLLYRDYEVKKRYIQVLFASTFATSASMFELLLLTLAGAVPSALRTTAWKVDHWILILLAYVMLPATFIHTTSQSVFHFSGRLARAATVIVLPFFWYAIWVSGSLIHVELDGFTSDLLIARIGVFGISVVATLSGFGAVNFPMRSIHSFLRPVSQQQVADVEQRLLGIMKIIASKKRQLLQLRQEEVRSNALMSSNASGGVGKRAASNNALQGSPGRRRFLAVLNWAFWLGKTVVVALVGSGNSLAAERQQLQTDIAAMEAFSRELFVELDELIKARVRELQAKTCRGHLLNILGYCCSAVCVYKIFMSAFHLLLRQNGSTESEDPATRLLDIMLVNLEIPLDASYWVPVLSQIFVGYLTFANTRQFIQRLLTVFRMVSTSVTSNSLALLLTEVMAMYFAACILLMLRFVPRQDRGDLLAMVGDLDLTFVHLHFDYVFLISSLCTVAVFGLGGWIRGEDVKHCD